MTPLRAQLACELPCTLGEGLLWDERARRWCWTDIEDACIHTWAGPGHAPERHALPDRLGSFAITRSGRWLLGLSKGLAWGEWSGAAVKVTPFCPVEAERADSRINDGRTDRSGRFVFGTLHEAAHRERLGGFYQYGARHGLRRLALPAVRIANSICFSPDGGTMYFTDTPSGLIQQCPYDSDSATVGEPRPFARVDGPGYPDGAVVDADGCLWTAQWGGGRVQRFSPDGDLLMEVQAAATQITCPAFGGPGLETLMFTSAREGLDAAARARRPLAGSVFSCRPPAVRGLPDTLFDDTGPETA